MPPKRQSLLQNKRKSPSSPDSSLTNNNAKKTRSNGSKTPIRESHPDAQQTAENGIVLRAFYAPEMSNERALAYKNGELPRPIEVLHTALSDTKSNRDKIKTRHAVVHWFKCDLRTRDNTSLYTASEKAKKAGVPLITMYIISSQDFKAHLTSPARVDFILRQLRDLRSDLDKMNIPLYVEVVEKRREIPQRILQLLDEWGASHFFANAEYEVDELRRDAGLVRACLEKDIAMDVLHDTCVVKPGVLVSGSGAPYSVYTPWYRSWVTYIYKNPEVLDLFDAPHRNPENTREKYGELFQSIIPSSVKDKELSEEERDKFRSLWPSGEEEAHQRLKNFARSRIQEYHAHRDFPAQDGTASISVYLASGALSARTAVRTARDHNTPKKLDGGHEGIETWISEVAWRDFYKHVLCHSPYICMNKPFKIEYSNIEWEYDQDQFAAWCQGKTGYPLVDAAMRQLGSCGWMHNRCRMVVASFLAKDLLIDWRMGERYFMEHLIDGDFASNNGGWGFSASTGVDPQPYFRIFNPILQSERFDPKGDYIRKWVPELSGIEGKAIHDPYNRERGNEAQRNGYPKPIVDHKESRDRCLARYKVGLGRTTA
ncbi:putative Deoxyribodipyrimidine photo-lyase [Xylogone sp. PMI_703]|nr:putative Deoxyribodipyrimidine photo-lyase [Xylogone sp. PMI_703]